MSENLFDLTGQVAIVTGTSRGLGQYLARALARAGADLVITSRKRDALTDFEAEVEDELGRRVNPAALTYVSLYIGGANFNPAVNNTAFYHQLFQTSIVRSNYNAVQFKIQGATHGLNLTGSYSFSHSLDNGADPLVPGAGGSGLPRNSFDLRPEYWEL